MQLTEMPEIDRAIWAQSWSYMEENYPALAAALKAEVARGTEPTAIKRHIWLQTQRPALALRCEQAALHLKGEQS